MIKQYMRTMFVFSLSLLCSYSYAGKIILRDGKEVEIPDSIAVRNNVHELRGASIRLANEDPFDLWFNMATSVEVNKDKNVQEPIEKLTVLVNDNKYFLTYPTYAYIAAKDISSFSVEYKAIYYRLSDVIDGNRDKNGLTVQDAANN